MKRSLLVPLLAVLVASLCFAQNQTLPQKIAHLYAPLDKSQCGTGYFFDLCVPLAEPMAYRGSTPLKALTFTPKTQHRRRWPQPLSISARAAAASPLSVWRGVGGEAPNTFIFNHIYDMKKHFIITLPLLLGRAGVGLLLALAYALLLSACHKDDDPYVVPPDLIPKPDTLPAMTTIGANTFGCKVNGKVWIAKADWKAYFDPSFQLIDAFLQEGNPPKGGFMSIHQDVDAISSTGVRQSFTFELPGRSGIFYSMQYSHADSSHFSVYFLNNKAAKWYYPTDSGVDTSNQLNITKLDAVNNILSGTFKFKLYRGTNDKITNRADSMVVTDGRFDIHYSN